MPRPFDVRQEDVVNKIGLIAGYPLEIWDSAKKNFKDSEHYLYQSKGPIQKIRSLENNVISFLDRHQLITTSGQDGSPFQLVDRDEAGSLKWSLQTVGIHAGNYDGLNYITMMGRNLFVSFIYKHLKEFQDTYGKDILDYEIEFKKTLDDIDLNLFPTASQEMKPALDAKE